MMTTAVKERKLAYHRRINLTSDLLLRIYDLARAQLSDKQIIQALNITQPVWKRLLTKKDVVLALKRARNQATLGKGGDETWRTYVYRRLPSHLQDLWDKINACEKAGTHVARIDDLLTGHSENVLKHLFLYALVHMNWNISEACRLINIPHHIYKKWVRDDDFAELLEQMHFHQKNFCEGALMKLVEGGDTAAIIFANKTLNRDRGYNPSVTIKHEGSVDHNHLIDIDKLGLSLEQKLELLQKYRAVKEEPKQIPCEVTDAV